LLIYGKEIRAELLAAVQGHMANMTLAVAQIGEAEASRAYTGAIEKFAADAGAGFRRVALASSSSSVEAGQAISRLNDDDTVTGIMLQMPLPGHLDAEALIRRIAPEKDVEGVTPYRLGALLRDPTGVAPCTAKAVMRLLRAHQVTLRGRRVTVVGQSVIVGKPLALMLMAERATVTVCNSGTADLSSATLPADIVVAAVGQIGLITPDMIRPGAVVVDVGTNFDAAGNMRGDVDAASADRAAMLSAVPGGVGVITVAELFDNLRRLGEERTAV
jgi:methylenetetrahydrofolate dehydrogenase (NADP+)/methenyltetrahydrofolate cyclohydrolase